MKEFCSQTGGRQTYVDDILNLQDLALAFSSIFDGCGNFVISGCKQTSGAVGEGYVYINGKVRRFAGATNIAAYPQYLCEKNSTENIAYASGSDKVGRNIFGCTISSSIPTTNDPITGVTPEYIQVTASGFRTLKDAFIGKYAILNESTNKQEVTGNIDLLGQFTVTQAIRSNNAMHVGHNNALASVYFNVDGDAVFEANYSGTKHSFIISDNGIKASCQGNVIAEFTTSSLKVGVEFEAPTASIGSIKVGQGHIYNSASDGDDGVLGINVLGLNGGSSVFRTTVIGNGKGDALLTVSGLNSTVESTGVFSVNNQNEDALVIKSHLPNTNSSILKKLAWKDVNNNAMAYMGFANTSNNIFSIENHLSSMKISGTEFVDIGPEIREGGVALSSKYVRADVYIIDMANKANANEVYSTTRSDMLFAKLASGFSQFIFGSTTAATLRGEIGAISESEAKKAFPTLSNKLSDMAATDDDKKTICRNIGAALSSETQAALSDSGWVALGGGLFIRQIGNIVAIQGTITTVHSGTVFSIPNNIDPPTHSVGYQVATRGSSIAWKVSIASKSRNCVVDYCEDHGKVVEFNLIYMV